MAKRRWFAVFGGFEVLSGVALLAVFGFPALDSETAVMLLSFIFVGVLFVLGGLSGQIGAIEWYQFVGGGWVLMGVWWFIVNSLLMMLRNSSLGDAGAIYAVASLFGGLVLVFIGVDWMRGGHHLEISQYEPGPLFGSTNRNQA